VQFPTTSEDHVKKLSLLLLVCMLSMLAFAQTESSTNSTDQAEQPPMLGITWAKGAHHDLTPSGSPDMTYHGGRIMPLANATAIFWGTSWAHYTGLNISGMDSWYQGFGNSGYSKTSDEYTGSNGQVGPTLNYAGHYLDTSPAGDGNDTNAILAEVCKEITNPDPSGNGYYPVYVDLARGSNNYCAYHGSGRCYGVPVQFAFFFKLDGDAGCNPNDTSGLHPEGLAALANVSGHELSEARTDPQLRAWYDSSGQENGDKCAWTFGVPLVTFSNGTQWKIQGEWSNEAYNNGTGYPNSLGQDGCLEDAASVTLTPNYVNFGTVGIGDWSGPKPVTLTNDQAVTLSISSITIRPALNFRQTNNCGTLLGPHAKCTISVEFRPLGLLQKTGWLTVTDNGPGSPQTALLTGKGGD
jgi:hypothetical protein